MPQKALLNPGSLTTWARPFWYLGNTKLIEISSTSVALAESTNPYCSRIGFIILVPIPSIWALKSANFLLISIPFKASLEADKPAPHNSFASNSKLKTKERKAFNPLKWLTCWSNFFWNFSLLNLIPLRALIRADKICLTPTDSPLIDKSNWRAFKDNSSIGSLKKSSGQNSDLKDALNLW